MRVIYEYPPNIEELDATFHIKGKPILFTYGDAIYCPDRSVFITPELYAHEQIHSNRQTSDRPTIEKWWERYLVDSEFRLNEELLAHRAEYKKYCDNNKDRNKRSLFLNSIAGRLASSMYGNVVTPNKARRIILGEKK